MIVLVCAPSKDQTSVGARAVGNEHRITGVLEVIHDTCPVRGPRNGDGTVREEGTWCAAHQRQNAQSSAGYPR